MHTLKHRHFVVVTPNDVVNFMGKLCWRCRAGRSDQSHPADRTAIMASINDSIVCEYAHVAPN